MGVLVAIKNFARKKLLLQIIQNLKNYRELRVLCAKQSNGMRQVDCCYLAHVLDAVRVIWYAYEKLLPQTVSKCWIKARNLEQQTCAKDLYRVYIKDLTRLVS